MEDNKKPLGLDIDLSVLVGQKVVDEYIKSLSEEDIKIVYDAIDKDLFTYTYNDKKEFKKTYEVKGYYNSKYEETPLYMEVKKKYQEKFSDLLIDKIDKLLDTDKYKKRIQDVSEEIIEYAIEGYKEDLKKRIRERLVDNVIGDEISYNNQSLRFIINEEINKRINY